MPSGKKPPKRRSTTAAPQKLELDSHEFAEMNEITARYMLELTSASKGFFITLPKLTVVPRGRNKKPNKHEGKLTLTFSTLNEVMAQIGSRQPGQKDKLAGDVLMERLLRADVSATRARLLAEAKEKNANSPTPGGVEWGNVNEAAHDEVIKRWRQNLSLTGLQDIVRGKRRRERLKPKAQRAHSRSKARRPNKPA